MYLIEREENQAFLEENKEMFEGVIDVREETIIKDICSWIYTKLDHKRHRRMDVGVTKCVFSRTFIDEHGREQESTGFIDFKELTSIEIQEDRIHIYCDGNKWMSVMTYYGEKMVMVNSGNKFFVDQKFIPRIEFIARAFAYCAYKARLL